MSMKEKNQIIVKMIRDEIYRRRLMGKLDVYPVENTFTRRPRFWNDGNVNLQVLLLDSVKFQDGEIYTEFYTCFWRREVY